LVVSAFLLTLLVGCISTAAQPVPSTLPSTQPSTQPATQPVVVKRSEVPAVQQPIRPAWRKAVEYIVLNADISGGEREWAEEFRDVLPEAPVVVVVHGGYEYGVWTANPIGQDEVSLTKFVTRLKWKYDDRPILLISCNEEGHALNVKGVWYAKSIVCSRPGSPGLPACDKCGPTAARHWSDFVEGR
jgi:hypothetical protein